MADELPKAKQTSLALYVTASEAFERWKAAPDQCKIIDVRTMEEYFFVGHATMAWNVPVAAQLYTWDPEKKKFPMVPLSDFVDRIRTIAGEGDTLMVMCRSGGRSAIAVNQLAASGFKNVYNIVDGMEGDTVDDPDSVYRSKRMRNGWKNSGPPWTYDVDQEKILAPKP